VLRKLVSLLIGFVVVLALHVAADSMQAQMAAKNPHSPHYAADGKMEFPSDYREWIFLSSGVDMSYSPRAMAMNHSMFDNVFVNPEAYKAFVATGTWPDKTMLVLEGRMATSKGSINKKGHYQTGEDEARFPGKWAFFGDNDGKPSKQIPTNAPCYSCHQDHGAVDTTFVQFYPTLLEIAKAKGTLAAGYMKEEHANTADQTGKK
jgi:hypothetical protein